MKNLVIKNRLKALLLAGIMLTGTGATLSACSKEEANSYSASIDYNSFEDLLKSLPEGIKKENLQTIYNVLYNLNGSVANSVKVSEDKDKLFQMNWDTIQALALASNDYTSQEMLEMFDNFGYDADYLYELYKNFSSIFIPFGERITTSTGLANLIKDDEQRGDFLKYENILIDINVAREKDNQNELDALYKTAFAYIREDFLSNRGGSSFANGIEEDNKATGYNALKIAYVNTILELGRNSKHKLSDAEIKELNSNGICNTALASIEDNLEGLYRKLDSLNEEIELAGTYEKARALAIETLGLEGLYFVDWEHSTLPILTGEKLLFNTIEVTNNYVSNAPRTSKKVKKSTRKYNSLDDLKKHENSDVVKKAEEGKKKVDEEISKENQKNKEQAEKEASEKASQESAENKKDSDDRMDEIRDNAQVVDPDGKVDSDKEIVQPDNENEAIAGVDEDREYDGPAYDKDGNIIVQSKSYTKSSNEETCTVNNVNANVKLLVKSL